MSNRSELNGLTVKQQITLIYDHATSALSLVNEWSGWGGKSIKDHIEDVQTSTDSALNASHQNYDAIEKLIARVEALEGVGQ